MTSALSYRRRTSAINDASFSGAVWAATARTNLEVCALYVHGIEYAPHQRLIAVAFTQLVQDELRHPVTGEIVHRLAISGPPRHGKTSVVDEHGIPWYLGRWPWRKVMHFTSNDPLALSYDAAIAATLESNEKHRAVFPECEPWKKKGWSSLVGRYLTQCDGKDPSFSARGIGGGVLGAGADLIIMDDVVDQRMESSEADMRAVKLRYDTEIDNRLNPGGHILYIGHRWGPADFMAHLIERWGFVWLNFPALSGD